MAAGEPAKNPNAFPRLAPKAFSRTSPALAEYANSSAFGIYFDKRKIKEMADQHMILALNLQEFKKKRLEEERARQMHR